MIPNEFYIDEQRWIVVWRSLSDKTWKKEKSYGITYRLRREIHLCQSLHADPSLKQTIWLHELMHAVFPNIKGISDRMEENLILCLSDSLSRVLNQVGWKREE